MDLRLEKSLQGAGLGKGDTEDKQLVAHAAGVPSRHVTDVIQIQSECAVMTRV